MISSNKKNNKSKAVILGSATNLISSKVLSELVDINDAYILGGNLCFLEHNLDFFFSSYFVHCELCRIDNDAAIFKFSTNSEKKTYPNELIKIFYSEHLGIYPDLVNEGFVCTEFNQLIGMTHFATSLGVEEIIYSGFNQNDYKYFWQTNPKNVERINELIIMMEKEFIKEGYIKSEQDKEVLQNIIFHQENLDSFSIYPFYNKSIIKSVFSDLEALKIKFSSLDQVGIISEIIDEA